MKDSKDEFIRAGLGKGEPIQRTLDVLYLLTNDESEWLEQLKDTLKKDGWNTIRTSRDITLDQEQTDVNMAVDMDIARRAAVFIGNGVRGYALTFESQFLFLLISVASVVFLHKQHCSQTISGRKRTYQQSLLLSLIKLLSFRCFRYFVRLSVSIFIHDLSDMVSDVLFSCSIDHNVVVLLSKLAH